MHDLTKRTSKELGKGLSVATALARSRALAQRPAAAKAPAQVKDAKARREGEKATAVVAAVDRKNRIVTVKGPEGNKFAALADDSIQSFRQIKAGDKPVVDYFQAVTPDPSLVRLPPADVHGTAPPRRRRESRRHSRARALRPQRESYEL